MRVTKSTLLKLWFTVSTSDGTIILNFKPNKLSDYIEKHLKLADEFPLDHTKAVATEEFLQHFFVPITLKDGEEDPKLHMVVDGDFELSVLDTDPDGYAQQNLDELDGLPDVEDQSVNVAAAFDLTMSDEYAKLLGSAEWDEDNALDRVEAHDIDINVKQKTTAGGGNNHTFDENGNNDGDY